MRDYFGVTIQEGDIVVYGKSCRYNPLAVGIVQSVSEDSMKVLGHGCTKVGEIRCHNGDKGVNRRVVVLSEEHGRINNNG